MEEEHEERTQRTQRTRRTPAPIPTTLAQVARRTIRRFRRNILGTVHDAANVKEDSRA